MVSDFQRAIWLHMISPTAAPKDKTVDIGIGIGLAVGSALDNITLGIILGIAMGASSGVLLLKTRRDNGEDSRP